MGRESVPFVSCVSCLLELWRKGGYAGEIFGSKEISRGTKPLYFQES